MVKRQPNIKTEVSKKYGDRDREGEGEIQRKRERKRRKGG